MPERQIEEARGKRLKEEEKQREEGIALTKAMAPGAHLCSM